MMPQMRMLFLDDEQWRHDGQRVMKSHYYIIDHVYNVAQAIAALRETHYDVVSLDHDLQEDHYKADQPFGTGTGLEVARYIAANPSCCRRVIVHSLNEVGGRRMLAELLAAGVSAIRMPFTFTGVPIIGGASL